MLKKLKTIRMKLLVMLTHNVALPMLKIFRKTKKFPYTLEEFGQFEQGTLGRDLHDFLQSKELRLLPHYTRHDLKHILLRYDTTEKGEACLQCFMFGNGRVSFPVLATVLYAFFTMPEYWTDMKKAYRQGKKATPFHHWPWTALLHDKTDHLRSIIFKQQSNGIS